MTDIKERPILFSAPMVRAILEGRKTVTRREVKKPAALDCLAAGFEPSFLALPGNADLCPYGKPGDRLWVRETTGEDCRGSISTTTYSADGAPSDLEWWYSRRSCPSIHMPRKACRILLEITAIRVERLQDITDEQAEAEGVDFLRAAPDLDETLTAAHLFDCLWSSINGAESWNADPWVWVVEFKQVTP